MENISQITQQYEKYSANNKSSASDHQRDKTKFKTFDQVTIDKVKTTQKFKTRPGNTSCKENNCQNYH